MSNRANPILVLAAGAALLLSSAAPLAQQDDDVAGARVWLGKVADALEDVTFTRATYKQTQNLATLLKPRITTGRLYFRREPACLVMHVDPEAALRIRMEETSHLVYRPANKRADRYLFEANHLARAIMRCFTSEIRAVEKTFEIGAFRSLEGTHEIDLVPRDEKARSFLRLLSLRIRAEDATIVSIAYVDAGGDEVRIDLQAIERAPKPEEMRPLFDAALPDDVELFERAVGER